MNDQLTPEMQALLPLFERASTVAEVLQKAG